MESPVTKPLAPRPRARISRLGWGLLIAQAALFPCFFPFVILLSYIPALKNTDPPLGYIGLLLFAFVLLVLVGVYANHERGFSPVTKLLQMFLAWTAGVMCVLIYAQIGQAIYFRTHSQGHRAAETKQNLHAIQLAVERYATDNEGGYYPDYILGGTYEDDYVINEEYYKKAFATGENPFSGTDTPPPAGKLALPGSGDWAVMEGYMPMYPKNPFRKWNSESSAIPSSTPGPYRQVYVADFKPMVQVAADHRFPGALIGERYWMWKRKEPLAESLQGSFIYKGLIPQGEKHPRGYILLVFGGPEDEGKDALTTVPGGHELDGRLQDGSGVGMGVPVIPELGIRGDGKPDGIIFVLTGGWPFEETGEGQQQ